MTHNYYVVITAKTLLRKDISSGEKLLIALISNLSNERGFCFATNSYLADNLNCSERTIREYLTNLEEKRIIGRVIHLKDNMEVDYRALTIINSDDNPMAESRRGYGEESPEGCGEISPHNNKVFNNKENNTRKRTKKVFVKPTLEEVCAYFLSKGSNSTLAVKAYQHYEAGEWKDSKGNPVINWKQKMLTNWINSDTHKNQTSVSDPYSHLTHIR